MSDDQDGCEWVESSQLAVSNGMPAVKLYANRILQFLTGGAG